MTDERTDARVWIDERLVDAGDATLSYDDHAITVGDGVFETIKVARGNAFALSRHLGRLANSAALMRLPSPDPDLVRRGIDALLSTDSSDGFIRLTITAGPGPLASNRGETRPRLIIARRPGAVRVEPTDVLLVDWRRNERSALTGVKSTSYGENVVALEAALEKGCSEALFANTVDELCEGTGSNVFVGIGGELVTPPLESGCLAGITRALLLEAGVGVERTIPMSDMGSASEMFLVSTAREVQPVLRMNDQHLSSSAGPLTVAAAELWNRQIEPQLDP